MEEMKTSGAEAEQTSLGARIGNVRWTICAMLFVATSISYMDRQVLALLKPLLMQDAAHGGIGMTDVGFGWINGVFQAAYAIGMLFAGRFVDKVGSRIGYMCIMAFWSLSAMSHSLVNSMMQFGLARVCLGLGESGNFPAANKTNAEWFPQNERSLSFGIFNSGANMGAILAPVLVPLIAASFGWHPAFLITGFFSATWILIWFFYYRLPEQHPRLTKRELNHITEGKSGTVVKSNISWFRLLAYPQTWGFTIAKGFTDPIWWFFLYWLPDYFSTQYGLNMKHVGIPLIVVYTASTVGSIFGGWLPMPFVKMGLKPARARLLTMAICAVAVVPIIGVNFTHSMWFSIALLSLAAAAHQGWSANLFTTASDMFPQATVGSVTSIGGMAGSVGGTLSQIAIGYILLWTHRNYSILFVVAGSAYLVSLLILNLLAPNLKKAELNA